MDEYVYLNCRNYSKFKSALELYNEWHELNKYLDEHHPMKMDGYGRMIVKRIECKNVIYKLLNLGFIEIESTSALANGLMPLVSDNQFLYSEDHATLKILDGKKWTYFKIKAEL